jgi:hypothetical protein
MERKKFESWGKLEDFMYSKGWNHVLFEIEDIEIASSKRHGERVKREDVRKRILIWFNQKPLKADVTLHRASFVLANELSKKVRKLGKVM